MEQALTLYKSDTRLFKKKESEQLELLQVIKQDYNLVSNVQQWKHRQKPQPVNTCSNSTVRSTASEHPYSSEDTGVSRGSEHL